MYYCRLIMHDVYVMHGICSFLCYEQNILQKINATLIYKILHHHLKIYKDDAKTLSIKLYNAEM